MTEARKEYLKYCPVSERFCREELRISANRIKNLKRELTLQTETCSKVEENNRKYYDGFVQVTKAFLMMEKARYRAIKKLLPKRKQVKK